MNGGGGGLLTSLARCFGGGFRGLRGFGSFEGFSRLSCLHACKRTVRPLYSLYCLLVSFGERFSGVTRAFSSVSIYISISSRTSKGWRRSGGLGAWSGGI